MASDRDKSAEEPNLELPSLFGLGRRRKRARAAADPSPAPEGDAVPAASDPLDADPVPPPPDSPPGDDSEPPVGPTDRAGEADLAPAPGRARRRPPVPPPSTTTQPAEPPPGPVGQPAPAAATDAAASDAAVPDAAATAAPSAGRPAPQRVATTADPPARTAAEEPGSADGGRRLQLPEMAPTLATPLAGTVVGLLGVALAWLAAQGCEVVRGVGSCGGIGFLALTAIVAAEVVAGAALLKALGVTDHTVTSVLGVGLVAMVALVFLLGSLMTVAMVVVLPLLTAAAFLAAWWLTHSFATPAVDDRLHR